MSKSNICVIGLSKQFTDDVCRRLSIRLDMYYANISELLEYEIMDLDKLKEVCGVEYLQNEEKSIISRVCSYENTLLNIEFSKINVNNILKVIKQSCLLIYLKIDKLRLEKEQSKDDSMSEFEKSMNVEMLSYRNTMCEKIADVIVDCKDLVGTELIEHIINDIVNLYS